MGSTIFNVLHYTYFQVALRIRPMSEDEIIQGATPIAHKVDKNVSDSYRPYQRTDMIVDRTI